MIIYWSDEESCFIAEVQELAGCMADGNTYEEAVKNTLTVIDQWIETAESTGRPIPKPRGRLKYA